jgi:hypothetical protein
MISQSDQALSEIGLEMPLDQIIAKLIAQTDEAERRRECALAPIVAGIAQARQRRDFVEVGRLLVRAKRIVPYGQWMTWLEEIGMPYQCAVQSIRLAKGNRAAGDRWGFRRAAE